MILPLLLSLGINPAITIKSTQNAKIEKLNKLLKANTAVILYTANCSSCRIQIKDLDCLKNKKDIVLLGAFTSEKDLRMEHIKYHPRNLPSYYASAEILSELNIKTKETPQILLINEKNIKRFTGLQKCETLLKVNT